MASKAESSLSFRVGPLIVDGRAREVMKNGTRIPLSDTEFRVFYEIVERRGGLIHQDEFTACAPRVHLERRHPVEMHIHNIRKKVGDSIVVTEARKGYRLSSELTVERVSEPSLSELERHLSITLHQSKDYTDAAFRAAIENCQELLKLKKFPEAYAVLALGYINLGHVGLCRELLSVAFARAKNIINEALDAFPQFGSAYALRGLIAWIHKYDWDKAEKDFEQSLRFSPQNALGHRFLAHLEVSRGRFDQGLSHARIAADLDYERALAVITEPWLMYFAGKVDEAIPIAEQIVKRFTSCGPAHTILGHLYVSAGAVDQAIGSYNRALEIEFLPAVHASLGFVYGQQGKRREALQHVQALYDAKKRKKIAYVSSYFDAMVQVGLGSKEKALDALEQAFEEKCDWLVHLAVEPRWGLLRKEKRFQKLLRRVGIRKPHSTPS